MVVYVQRACAFQGTSARQENILGLGYPVQISGGWGIQNGGISLALRARARVLGEGQLP